MSAAAAAAAANLEARLRGILRERYHHRHPFNLRLHGGRCSREEVQRWVRNRYYYQTRIPIKDGLILTKAEDREFRRGWIRRIRDHDGDADGADGARAGGLDLWLQLAEACGLDRAEVASLRGVLPGVRRACDAYVAFVAGHDLLESVAASLTELSAGPFLAERAAAFRRHYGWIAEDGLAYFLSRTEQAPRDAGEGLAFVLAHAKTPADADRCAAALLQKCEILWQLLDGVEWGGRRPHLARAARLREEAAGGMLAVLPERAVQIGGSGPDILRACDGAQSAEQIARNLCTRHGGAQIEAEVFGFIERMEVQGVLEMHP